ncbi:MAG: 30S ribosomal protein S12 methylthiotransferase RimO [Lachnospiraceae bacterium]
MNVLFVSLGCDKNLVDSEEMLGLLAREGHSLVDEEEKADIIVVNTCCFIQDAKEESIETILGMVPYKTEGVCKALIVTGCMAQRYKEEIIEEIPEVDAVLGTSAYDTLIEAINTALGGHRAITCISPDVSVETPGRRLLTTGGHYAYLKIAEGCDKHCTYCIIPSLRGKYRSVPLENLVSQAQELAEAGVKELILVAQETTLYGMDLYKEKRLHQLLEALSEVQGIVWIRVLYCYPEEIYPALVEAIARLPKVCNYIDLPIQHANNEILRRMGRRTTKEELIAIVTDIRARIPGVFLRTSLITGFPGETQEQHEELMAFVNAMEFDRLGVFTYSAEEDTPAASFSEQIPEEVKEDRKIELMELQQEISYDKGQERIGQEMLVMMEGRLEEENTYVGRTYGDAPNVDGYIFVAASQTLVSGDFAKVRVTGALEYDLMGELIDEYTE